MTPVESWGYRFSEPGADDLFCFPHLGLGMMMRIVVFDPDENDIDDAFEAPTAGPLFPNVERVLSSPEPEPEAIIEAGTVAWEDLTLEADEPNRRGQNRRRRRRPKRKTRRRFPDETADPTAEPETDTPGTLTETSGTPTETAGTGTEASPTATGTPPA